MIESKELITGEVQGTSETKFVVLTEEEITKMMKKAAREGAKEDQEEDVKEDGETRSFESLFEEREGE